MLDALSLADPSVALTADTLVERQLQLSTCDRPDELERLGADEVPLTHQARAVELRAALLKVQALVLLDLADQAQAASREVVAAARDAGLVGLESEALSWAASADGVHTGSPQAIGDLEDALERALAAGTDGRAFFIAEALTASTSPKPDSACG